MLNPSERATRLEAMTQLERNLILRLLKNHLNDLQENRLIEQACNHKNLALILGNIDAAIALTEGIVAKHYRWQDEKDEPG